MIKLEKGHTRKKLIAEIFTFVIVAALILTSCDLLGSSDEDENESDTDPASPTIMSFSTSDELVTAGETVTLSWTVSGESPMTLTLEPGGRDVSGATSAEVTPAEKTTYRLIAENQAGNDEAEVTVSVVVEGESALEINISGLPDDANANVAITNHNNFIEWATGDEVYTELSPSDYTVTAGGVNVSGSAYLPGEGVQSITLNEGETVNVQVNYAEVSGNIYATEPDVGSCSEGALTQETKVRALFSLNFIRTLAGLPPVDYDSGSDDMVQKASLMFAANSEIDHFPPSSWHCYSDEGAEAAEKSNIGITLRNSAIEAVPEDFITLWADDEGVPSLGHRRWLIDPFLPHIAAGLVEGTPQTGDFSHAAGAALRILPDQDADISGLPLSFVAYPRGNFPTRLFTNNWFMSFSVLADPAARANNHTQIDYSGVNISVEDEGGATLTVTDIDSDYVISGLPNQLKWKVPGLEDDIQYTITITDVMVNGENEDFTYTLNLK